MNLDTLIQPHEGEIDTFCGMVAIVGRPNVGKSTLLNEIIEQKVSITSRKPQTTRHRIMGIHTEGKHQAVYVDTPGLHVEEKRAINRLMNRAASSSIGDVELIIFVVEGTHWNADDEMVLNKVSQSGKPVLLVINKIDQVKDRDLVLPHMKFLGDKFDFIGIMPVSATQGKNINLIKEEVTKRLPPCEFYFPDDYVTDRSMRFMAAEVIREKLMRFMGEELPYSVTVEIEQFKWQENGVWHINGLILVERETQKRMVIGNKGEKLKVIGREARKDLEEMLENKVFLELWVKVKSGWADDERALRSLGYGED
ncbi:membrane-associated, 16S rRNA-binding GTPase [Pseudoalteromonas sp. 3J6]|jgi:GTP-binding protein Era|uniref:GTPase Era n=1 Tax=unclassified Pseudoalteromonas TaxID=194690 RepID=UPI00110BC78E|nr:MULTISPECIES: GTPase Era [unclassified Pseudoalteromonas]MCK8128216.1 GTPase Era [Pseudoalteromonas sp. 2CM39R]MDN3486801.1 GTPase Era [Pseudoalteromonas sp. APC 3224]NWL17687.1 GTPase Era [Pseudoalteromonas sp. Scap03]QLE82162.1 GTPase Era [Pseudoalteromonas sp. Scap25]QLE90105.1 GTPase Era [Pseudoalteromonas sp. Scap06]